ncbi:hypothetical protein JW835_16105 [bacterium]|nr:hypothetical protein [bacterium]
MLEIIILVGLAVGLIALFIMVAAGGFQKGGGGPANVIFGATQDLLTHDQKKAIEVVVKKQAGETEEEQTSGESEK